MIKWIATIEPCIDEQGRSLITDWKDRMPEDSATFIGMIDGKVARLGVETMAPFMNLSHVRAVMHCVQASGVDRDAALVWSFSLVRVVVNALTDLQREWDESGQPPILSIIGLQFGDHQHEADGIRAFVGYRLAARFGDPAQSRDAARNLMRLARHAMVHDGLDPLTTYEGVDQRGLLLEWHPDTAAPDLVTIVLQSVRNGRDLN